MLRDENELKMPGPRDACFCCGDFGIPESDAGFTVVVLCMVHTLYYGDIRLLILHCPQATQIGGLNCYCCRCVPFDVL